MSDVPIDIQVGIERFLSHEAFLLEGNRFDDWLDLLSDDVRYFMPVRESVEPIQGSAASPTDTAFALFDDDKSSLKLRADRINTGIAHAEVPNTVTQRLITNVYVANSETGNGYDVRSNFVIYLERRARHSYTFYGSRNDKLRRTGDDWKITQREILLAQAILPSTISIFF